ncbi:IS1202 transposase [Streptococcus pneumoniae]|nr:IS1202 transposase [Streptococcus pneumoniae]VJU39112.1 IS1202 transposase [Streptococcus pneumoniae]VKK44695.1 IS1202 transposase [Streptococcus pneumoniae]VMF41470.1 IS1202 transposase [Streptococcus pneumoniae]VPH83240.1 IS1202 transposase [Streptococcus pneumoniae]
MNETKKYLVIKAIAQGKKTKKRACVELNLSERQINRLLLAYQQKGKEAFRHGNRNRKPKHAIPDEIKERILKKYLSYETYKPNVRHFCELLAEEEGIQLSDTTVRKILYKKNILSPKSHRKTKKRVRKQAKLNPKQPLDNLILPTAEDFLENPKKVHPSRPRKKFAGELIQMDTSPHAWFGAETSNLHLAIDDASGNILGAYFDKQETLNAYYHVLEQILANHGIPLQIKTDKRTVFTYQAPNSKKMEDDTHTQFGYACHQLGILLETTSIPQAKGRVERLNQTLQSRLPIELERNNIHTLEEANTFLLSYIQTFNEQFGNKTKLSVFEEVPNPSERNLILARLAERVVDSGHHIRFQNRYYIPTEQGKEVYFIRNTKALVIKAFDGDIYLNIADKIYHTKELLDHELYSKNFEQEPEQKKKDASISLHKPIRGNSHLSNNIFIKIKRIMKSLLVRSLILLNYKYSKMK